MTSKKVGSKRHKSYPRSTKAVPGKLTHKGYRQNTGDVDLSSVPGKSMHKGYRQKTGSTVKGFYDNDKAAKAWKYIEKVNSK